jgi:hypothetical protein
LFDCRSEVKDASNEENAPKLEGALDAESSPNLEDTSNAEYAPKLEGAPKAESSPNLEDASNAENAPNLEGPPKPEDAPKLETSEVPDEVSEDSPPSGRCAEEIRQETGSVKEASQLDECLTLREKEENLPYTNECFKEEREEMKKLERGKDLTLQTYGGIDNTVETLLQAPAESDDGPEVEDF